MGIFTGILNALLILTSLFMICLILIQRGKGGGLAGAFGGMGGSSAFGTKAGDVFTRITIYTAIVWGFLAMALVYQSNRGTESAWGSDTSTSLTKGIDEKSGGKGKAKATGTGAVGSTTEGKSGDTKPAATGSGSSKAPAATDLPPAIPEEKAAPKSK